MPKSHQLSSYLKIYKLQSIYQQKHRLKDLSRQISMWSETKKLAGKKPKNPKTYLKKDLRKEVGNQKQASSQTQIRKNIFY